MVFVQKKGLSLVLPCYNEEGIFRDSVKKLHQALGQARLDYEIIFVEDKSTDSTARLVKEEIRRSRNSRAIFHGKNSGRGKSVTDGIRAARGDIVGYIDIDLEIAPSCIPEMAGAIEDGYDVACANRHYDFTLLNMPRNLLHYAYSKLTSLLLSMPVHDPNAGCKFFRRGKILPVLKSTIDGHWFWDTEVMKRASLAGLRIKEIDVLYMQNKAKKSTVKVLSDTLHFISKLLWMRGEIGRMKKSE